MVIEVKLNQVKSLSLNHVSIHKTFDEMLYGYLRKHEVDLM